MTSRPIVCLHRIKFRILGNDPAMAYLNFAMVFLAAKRDELAVKALERGLVYDEDNTQISLLPGRHLAQAEQGRAGPGPGRSPHRAADSVRGGVRAAGPGAQGA